MNSRWQGGGQGSAAVLCALHHLCKVTRTKISTSRSTATVGWSEWYMFMDLHLVYRNPNPLLSSLARSIPPPTKPAPPSAVHVPFIFASFSSSTHLSHMHSPNPHAASSCLRARTGIVGFTYVIVSSSPFAMSRRASTAIRERAVR
jgi:hypothetical protein